MEDITPENIIDEEPLFGEGLGLDSIDALELGVALKKKFGVKFSSESADNKQHFSSVNALAEYITKEKAMQLNCIAVSSQQIYGYTKKKGIFM